MHMIPRKFCLIFVSYTFLFCFLGAAAYGTIPALAESPTSAPAQPPAAARAPDPIDQSKYLQEKLRTNAGAISIMVSGFNTTSSFFAEDIRNVVNDLRPGGQRALISYGEGGPHNLKDSIFLLGVHQAIVDENNLKLVKEGDPVVYGDIEERIRYVTKLYNAEFHILARQEIKSITELDGKIVNLDLPNSQTDLVAKKIFGTLGVNVKPANFDDALAQQKLLNGEISAMVLSDGAPRDSLLHLKREDGLHFLPLDEASVPGADFKPILAEYLPAELSSESYPNLIAAGQTIPTLASRMVLSTYNWPENGERYNRNSKFIDVFFSKIEEFRHPARHPKWKEVNIAAEVPGWKRFKPAQQWLDRNLKTASVTPGHSETGSRQDFDQFIAQRRAGSSQPLNAREREALFQEFRDFMEKQPQ
jgi:TRAP-type uncharacterized transport system substrate-binding protein